MPTRNERGADSDSVMGATLSSARCSIDTMVCPACLSSYRSLWTLRRVDADAIGGTLPQWLPARIRTEQESPHARPQCGTHRREAGYPPPVGRACLDMAGDGGQGGGDVA